MERRRKMPEWLAEVSEMYRRILVPIDGSSTSMRAVTEAAKLAHVCGARIDLLHVVEALSGGFEPTQIYLEEILPRFIQRGEKLLKDTASTLRAAGCPPRPSS